MYIYVSFENIYNSVFGFANPFVEHFECGTTDIIPHKIHLINCVYKFFKTLVKCVNIVAYYITIDAHPTQPCQPLFNTTQLKFERMKQ